FVRIDWRWRSSNCRACRSFERIAQPAKTAQAASRTALHRVAPMDPDTSSEPSSASERRCSQMSSAEWRSWESPWRSWPAGSEPYVDDTINAMAHLCGFMSSLAAGQAMWTLATALLFGIARAAPTLGELKLRCAIGKAE